MMHLISPGGKAHFVQAEGRKDFSDRSPVFHQSFPVLVHFFKYNFILS